MIRPILRHLSLLALALPLVFLSSDAGYTALGSGDYGAAEAKFAAALTAIGSDSKNPSFLRARMGHVEALLRKDAPAAKDEFLAHAKANTSTVTPDDFSHIGRAFTSAGKYDEAIDVLDAGMKMHAESPVLASLVDLIKLEAEQAGDTAALGKLAGLGYL
jgi:hypothetical protein